MPVRDTLIYSGRRWLGAEVTGHAYHGRFCLFSFAAPGDGRPWSTTQPTMIWRTFAELDLTGTDRALDFVRRHGALDHENRVGTNAEWPAFKAALEGIAQAWDPLDASETSYISKDGERRTIARNTLYELARPDLEDGGLKDVQVIAQDGALVLRPITLRAFLIASASSAFQRGVAMRICQYCGDWFELRRSDAANCSASCVTSAYKQRDLKAAFNKLKAPTSEAATLKTTFVKLKGHPRGERSAPAPSRPDHVSGNVARKRSGRKVSPKK
jgi:hypothetical protein